MGGPYHSASATLDERSLVAKELQERARVVPCEGLRKRRAFRLSLPADVGAPLRVQFFVAG